MSYRDDEPVTQPVTAPVRKDKPAPETAEERAQRIAQQVGAYWGRSCVAAWRTVFPPGWTRRPR
ncbi:hypothetical protein ACFY4C_20985 [Actinomadura viridis]|uniref:hypothetical protein n=1 Tax=Actinomadura viridis TaxID=58110 RepID=UPI0036866CE8